MTHERPAWKRMVTGRELDEAADKHGSYDQAYRALDITPDDVILEEDSHDEASRSELPPVAVNIGERAVALADIMAYYNKKNQLEGYTKRTGGGRPAYSSGVALGMRANLQELFPKFQAGIATLAAADAFRANGYDEADIELRVLSMKRALNEEFGPGKAYASDRNEVVEKAKSAA